MCVKTGFALARRLPPSTVVATSVICNRAFEFACRILLLAERLWQRGPAARHLASQLMRCGTSIGSNEEEAQEGQTKADFIAKLSISRKEARETAWWLKVAIRTEVVTPDEIQWELHEAQQLLAMIRSAILTARSSPSRGASP
jgi:four helix bundle protein